MLSVALGAGLFMWQPLLQRAGTPSAPGRTQGEVDSLLLEISRAAQNTSYSGILERQMTHAGRRFALRWRIFQLPGERVRIAFLAPDKVAGTEVLLKGDVIKAAGDIHIGNSLRSSWSTHMFRNKSPFQEIDLLQQNYEISVQRGTRFLQRPTLALAIRSREIPRPRLEALVDAEKKLVLRMKKFSADDSLEESIQFAAISFEAPEGDEFNRRWAAVSDSVVPRRSAEEFGDLSELLSVSTTPVLVPEKLPRGFALRDIRRFSRKGHRVVHLVYGDGLAYVSLFQRPAAEVAANKQTNRSRERNPHLSVVRGRISDISYSIVSEIPAGELQEMAASLVPVGKKQEKNIFVYLTISALVFIAAAIFIRKRWELLHV